MKRSTHFLVASALAIASTAGLASVAWPLEPTKVLGIEMSAPVAAIAVCPQYTNEFYITEICRPDPHDSIFKLRGLPDLGMPYSAYLKAFDTKVLSLALEFSQRDFRRLIEVLTQRYGAPSTRRTTEVVSGSGARLASDEVVWIGDRLIITVDERAGKIFQTLMSVTYLPTSELYQAEHDKGVSSTAKKF